MRKITLLILLCFSLLSLTQAYAGTTPSASLAPMLQKVLPAIVNIKADVKVTDLATLSRLQREKGVELNAPMTDSFVSMGSGVIIDADKGYIITNAHVINDAQSITISLGDGRHFTAKTVGLDKASDIGLLQIKAKKLTAITLSNASAQLKVGDVVAAIGNPFGLNQTVTSGIVSALGRASLGIENLENFIQTDASINQGNSGGALLDAQGQLVGVNTAILAPDRGSVGIGFAIPSSIVKSVVDQLIQYGDVRRGTLGIGAQDITPDLASAFALNDTVGSVITLVKINSPANKAGLEVGDVVKSINGTPIKNANDVVNTISFSRVNTKVNIDLLRNNKSVQASAVLTDPKKLRDESEASDPFLYGVALKDFDLSSPMHGDIKGIVIVSVEPDSHAWQADLRPGDVITSANRQRVSTIPELKKIAASSKESLVLNVLRGPGAVFLVINKEPS